MKRTRFRRCSLSLAAFEAREREKDSLPTRVVTPFTEDGLEERDMDPKVDDCTA